MSDAKEDLEDFVEGAIDIGTQYVTMGVYGYEDGSFNPDGVAVDATKDVLEEGKEIYSEVSGVADKAEAAAATLVEENAKREAENAAHEKAKKEADIQAAADKAAKDKRIADEAALNRRQSRSIGNTRVANVLGGSYEDDENKLSASSLLAL